MIRVLAIDDEEDVLELIKLQLEAAGGFVVKTQSDSSQAMTTAREFGPDVILLDIMMPKVDGSELAAQFKTDAVFGSTPLIFLTALVTRQETRTASFVGGTRTYLPKPIDWAELIASIQAAVNPSR